MLTSPGLTSRKFRAIWEKRVVDSISPIDCLIPLYYREPSQGNVAGITLRKTGTPITRDSASPLKDVVLVLTLYSTRLEAETACAVLEQWKRLNAEIGALSCGAYATLLTIQPDDMRLEGILQTGCIPLTLPAPNDKLLWMLHDNRRTRTPSKVILSGEMTHQSLVLTLQHREITPPPMFCDKARAAAEALEPEMTSPVFVQDLQHRIAEHDNASFPFAQVSVDDIRERLEDIAVEIDIADIDPSPAEIRICIERAIGRLDPGSILESLVDTIATDLISGCLEY